MPRSLPPSKRRHSADEDADSVSGANSAPPNAPFDCATTASVRRPPVPPSEAASFAFRPSAWPQRSRFASPIKQASDLNKLLKPVVFQKLSHKERQGLPGDIKELDKKICSTFRQPFIPRMARAYVKDLIDEDDMIYYDDDEDVSEFKASVTAMGLPMPTAQERALQEAETLIEIVERTEKSMYLQRHESAWNAMIHAPLLALALSHGCSPEVREEYIPAATTMPSCVPRLKPINTGLLLPREVAGTGMDTGASLPAPPFVAASVDGYDGADWDGTARPISGHSGYFPASSDHYGGRGGTGGRMVDFVLVLDPEPCSVLEEHTTAIAENLAQETGTTASVNQTTYNAIRFSPIAVAIETKTEVSATDDHLQLAMWTAAWHQRMEALSASVRREAAGLSDVVQPSSSQQIPPLLITLPLISVVDHAWSIYYACDRGDKLVLVGPEKLGSTQDLTKAYMLLKNLRHVAAWIDDEFREFLIRFYVQKSFLGDSRTGEM